MLKTRVISAVVGLGLLIAAILAGNAVFTVAVTFLAVVGVHEFYNAVSTAGYKPVRVIGYIACLVILLAGLNTGSAYLQMDYLGLCLFAAILSVFSVIVFSENRYTLNDAALTIFGVFYVVFLLLFIVLTRNLENGAYLIWLIFIGAWATDTFAYIFGSLFGKTKILPVISPKKSLEGSIGGVAGCIILMILYGMLLNKNNWLGYNIQIYHLVILGLLCGIISQIGDWGASAIKRYVKIKDYGKIMPGHGGVLDRFDSIMFVAPVVYFYVSLIIR